MAKKSSVAIAMTKADDDWRADCDLRTLMDAEAIEKDPKRLKAAQKLAKERLLDLAGIAKEGPNDES